MVTGRLTAHRRRPGSRPLQCAATARAQALVLRWFKNAANLLILALGTGISSVTACRYLHEAIDVIADRHSRWRRSWSMAGPRTGRSSLRAAR